MRTSEVLIVQAPEKRGPAIVRANKSGFIEVHGSTCVLSVPIASPTDGCCTCNSFSVDLANNCGMIALTVNTFPHKEVRQQIDFILAVRRDAIGMVLVDLDQEWVPKCGRIGGMSAHLLRVNIAGQWYTEHTEYSHKKRAGERYVDGDTLCRYLADEIDADAVIAAATTVEEEIAAKEQVPALQVRIKELTEQVADEQREKQEVVKTLDRAR